MSHYSEQESDVKYMSNENSRRDIIIPEKFTNEDVMLIEDWILEIEDAAIVNGWKENTYAIRATVYLGGDPITGPASYWREKRRGLDHEDRRSWEKMKEALRDNYAHQSQKRIILDQLLNMDDEGMTITDTYTKFLRLENHSGLRELFFFDGILQKEQTRHGKLVQQLRIALFKRTLDSFIRNKVLSWEFEELDELVDCIKGLDIDMSDEAASVVVSQRSKCNICGKMGIHTEAACWSNPNSPNYRPSFNTPTDINYSFVLTSIDNGTSLIDSGATGIFMNNSSDIQDLKKTRGTLILPNGSTTEITGKGIIDFHGIKLQGQVVPKISRSLLGVSSICDRNQAILFDKHNVWMLNTNDHDMRSITRKSKHIGKRKQNLYVVKSSTNTEQVNQAIQIGEESIKEIRLSNPLNNAKRKEKKNMKKHIPLTVDEMLLWHDRLGHTHWESVKETIEKLFEGAIVSHKLMEKVKKVKCSYCITSKMTRCPFTGTRTPETKPFSRVVSDLFSLDTSFNGVKYVATLTCSASKHVWVFGLKKKSEFTSNFKRFYKMVQVQHESNIKTLHDDAGGGYISNELVRFCEENYIKHTSTNTDTHQENGEAERQGRTLKDGGRTVLNRANLPDKYMYRAVQYTAYTRNRLSSKGSSFKNQSPFEVLSNNQLASFTKLKPFGCLVYAHIPKSVQKKKQKSNVNKRAKKCIFLGYPKDKSGYLVMDLVTKKEFTSRDCIFDERVFPYGEASDHLEPLQREQQFIRELLQGEKTESEILTELKERYSHQNVEIANHVEVIKEPRTVSEALNGPYSKQCTKAMDDEIEAHIKNRTYSLTRLPKGRRPIKSKWVFKVKYNSDGSICRFKARLVACGYSQIPGVDFFDTFSPVAKMQSVRTLLSLAARYKLKLHQIDVDTAFLIPKINEKIYMNQPEGYVDDPSLVCELNKCIYGLKQASNYWNAEIDKTLTNAGFIKCEVEPCVYTKTVENQVVIVILYVDDCIIGSSSDKLYRSTLNSLKSKYSLKELGELKWCLGLEVTQHKNCYYLSQGRYIDLLLERFGMLDSNPVATPLPVGTTFSLLVKQIVLKQMKRLII